MADDGTPATAPGPEDRAFDPTGMFMPGAVPVTARDHWQKRIAINIAFFWLVFPALDLAGSHPHPLRAVAVGVAVLAYVLVYNRLPRWRRPLVPTREVATQLAVLALITTVLTLADRSSWSLLFVFTAISGAMGLSRRAAVRWVLFCTLLTAVDERRRRQRRRVDDLADRDDGRDRHDDVRLPAADGGQPRRSCRRARRSPGSRSPRSACASRATCTTCSATA